MAKLCGALGMAACAVGISLIQATGAFAQEPDLIFRKSTTFRLLACHYTLPERGGVAGAFGLAEQVSDVSLSCRQIGPVTIKEKFAQGDVVFRQSRSLLFKKVQIVRGCDEKRNVLVYLIYSDKLVEGSPKNSTSSVPLMPWGAATEPPKCADWLKK